MDFRLKLNLMLSIGKERCKTKLYNQTYCKGLRALLIQKDVKLYYNVTTDTLRLRALLI